MTNTEFPPSPVPTVPVSSAPPVSTSPNTSAQTVSQYQNLQPNQRVAVFEDKNTRLTADNLTLEIGLEDNRTFSYPARFVVGISRPAIKANELNEIAGSFSRDEGQGRGKG